MIAEFDLLRFRRGRYWDGQCPGTRYGRAGVLTFALDTEEESVEGRDISFELTVPLGAMVMYGLLGTQYRATPMASKLDIRVEYSAATVGVGRPFSSPIAVPPEEPVVGLPHEFGEAVMLGARDAVEIGKGPGPGVLTFACAANGAIGSSPAIFRLIAKVVTALVRPSATVESEVRDAILELLP